MSETIPNIPEQSFGENLETSVQVTPERKKLITFNILELLSLLIPPREQVVNPILPVKGSMMVHAARGTGKTFFVVSMAHAIACGIPFLKWEIHKPRKVLVLDGEMATEEMKIRVSKIVNGSGAEMADPSYLLFIASDSQPQGLPDLGTAEGRDILRPYFEEAEVIIFDNLSTLFPSLRENENDDAMPIMGLLLELRRKGKTVIMVHHSGKNGQQRGSSRKEDLLNTVIALKRPDDIGDEQACTFDVKFEKTRGFFGKDAETFRAKLVETENDGLAWECVDLMDELAPEVIALSKEGVSQRKIAKRLDTSASKVNRILAKYKEKQGQQ